MRKRLLALAMAVILMMTSADVTAFAEEASGTVETEESIFSETEEERESEEEPERMVSESFSEESTTQQQTQESAAVLLSTEESRTEELSEEESMTEKISEEESMTEGLSEEEGSAEESSTEESSTEEESTEDVDIRTGNMTVEGDGFLSDMFRDALTFETNGQSQDNGNGILDIEVDGAQAHITYIAQQDCTIVVGIYDESGEKLLAMGKTPVLAGGGTVTADIDIGSIPEYFYAKAFMVDTYSLKPLSSVYHSLDYTKEMIDFHSQTVKDFKEELVLNLDAAEDNNFIVYQEGVTRIKAEETANVLKSSEPDDTAGTVTCVFENADDTLKGLKEGQLFSYEKSDNEWNVSIAKVETISVAEDGTVTMQLSQPDFEQVFQYIRIDSSGVETQVRGTVEAPEELINKKLEIPDNDAGLTGSIELKIEAVASLEWKIGWDCADVRLVFNVTGDASIAIEKALNKSIKLLTVEVPILEGVVTVGFDLYAGFTAEIKDTVSFHMKGTLGCEVDRDGNINIIKEFDNAISEELSGKFSIYLGFTPKLDFLGASLFFWEWSTAHAEISVQVGMYVEAEVNGGEEHTCEMCITGRVGVEYGIQNLKVMLISSERLSHTFLDKEEGDGISDKFPIAEFYKCFDKVHDTSFHFGESCPYMKQGEVVVGVKQGINPTSVGRGRSRASQLANTPVSGAKVSISCGGKEYATGITNENGEVVLDVPYGKIYSVSAAKGALSAGTTTDRIGDNDKNQYTIVLSNLKSDRYVTDGGTSASIVDGKLYMWKAGELPSRVPEFEEQIGGAKVKRIAIAGQTNMAVVGENNDLWIWRCGRDGAGSVSSDYPLHKVAFPVGKGLRSPNDLWVNQLDNSFVVDIAAILTDGSLWVIRCTGSNVPAPEQVIFPEVDSNVSVTHYTGNGLISTAFNGALKGASLSDGTIYSWKSYTYSDDYANSMTRLDSPKEWTGLTIMDLQCISYSHTFLVLLSDGSLWTWDGSAYSPEKVKSIDGAVQKIATSDSGSNAAITTDGALYMWGKNNYGQLGIGNLTDQDTPRLVTSEGVADVKMSAYCTGALMEDGRLYMWGKNDEGELGSGEISAAVASFENASLTLEDVESFCLSTNSSGAVTDSGLYEWGRDIGSSPQLVLFPTKIQIQSLSEEPEIENNADSDTPVIKTQRFTGLQAGSSYVVYEMCERFADYPLSSDNLLYINQATADSKGEINITYQPLRNMNNTDVFVVGTEKLDLSNAQVAVEDLEYNGKVQYTTPQVLLNGEPLAEGRDYELYGDWYAKDAGEYTITVQGRGLYTGSVTAQYKIKKEESPETPDTSESSSDTEMSETPSTPESSEVSSNPETSEVSGTPDMSEKPETLETPSTPDTSEKPETPEAPSTPDTSEVSSTPDTSEEPSIPETSETPDTPENPDNPDTPKPPTEIKDTDVKLDIIIPSMFFNNKTQNMKPSIFYEGERLIEGIDYTVEYLDDQKSVGEHKLKVTFMGDYSGECTCTYIIYEKKAENVKDISKIKFKLDANAVKNAYYTGRAIKPAVKVTGADVTENADYRVVYKNNYNAGKATVTIIGIRNEAANTTYVNTKTLSFNIKKINLKNNITANAYKNSYDYMGSPVTLDDLTLKLNNSSNNASYTLKPGTDYTVSYQNNSKAGTATATVKGIGNFTGSVKYQFTIKPVSLANIPDSAVTSVEYSPKGAKLKTITYGSMTLKEGTDYKAKYTYSDKKTKAVGTTVTIELTGSNACKGTSKTFANIPITTADFANCITKPSDIIIDAAKTTKRTVKVTDYAGVSLKADKDYSLAWDANEKTDGTMLTLTITPKDTANYTGSKAVNYRIAKNIGKEKNIMVKNKIYDGKNAVKLIASDIIGLDAKDFEIIGYKNNTKAGTARVTIQGIGQYYGKKTLKFKITD